MQSMYFVGIDLSWSPKNDTGVAILKKTATHESNIEKVNLDITSLEPVLYYNSAILKSDEEIVSYICDFIGDNPCFIGVDATLTVSNIQGNREAEKQLNKDFRKYHAGTHPVNRTILSKYSGYVRGERISKMFNEFDDAFQIPKVGISVICIQYP